MKICIVVASAQNNVIGSIGLLPWKLSEDLKIFRKLTLNHIVVMGRKTYESIGKPLPKRQNFVISRSHLVSPDKFLDVLSFYKSIPEAIAEASLQRAEKIFIIGGGEIYKQAMPFVNNIYWTKVKANPIGDTFFETPDVGEWQEVLSESYYANEQNDFDFDFVHLKRIAKP